METLLPVLSEHPFLRGLDSKYIEMIATVASNVNFELEQIVYREGEPANTFYLIRKGIIGLEIKIPNRGTIAIQTISQGETLGWSWLIPPYKWRFTARVYETTMAIALDGASIRRKCEQDHELGYELYRRLSDIIVQRLQATRFQLLDFYGTHP